MGDPHDAGQVHPGRPTGDPACGPAQGREPSAFAGGPDVETAVRTTGLLVSRRNPGDRADEGKAQYLRGVRFLVGYKALYDEILKLKWESSNSNTLQANGTQCAVAKSLLGERGPHESNDEYTARL